MIKTKDQEMRERFWRIWKNFDDFGNHDTDPYDLLELFDKEIAKAREGMIKELAKIKGVGPETIKKLITI